MSAKAPVAGDSVVVTTSNTAEGKLGDARPNVQAKRGYKKTTARKGHSINRTIEEAKQLLGNSEALIDMNSARQLRKKPAPVVHLAAKKRTNKKGGGRPPKKAKAAAAAAAAANAAAGEKETGHHASGNCTSAADAAADGAAAGATAAAAN